MPTDPTEEHKKALHRKKKAMDILREAGFFASLDHFSSEIGPEHTSYINSNWMVDNHHFKDGQGCTTVIKGKAFSLLAGNLYDRYDPHPAPDADSTPSVPTGYRRSPRARTAQRPPARLRRF
jgi:hypothetical protein